MESLVEFVKANAQVLGLIAVIWVLPWKGVALWKAATLGKKGWFVLLLLVNTLAVLDILYIFVFSKMRSQKGE